MSHGPSLLLYAPFSFTCSSVSMNAQRPSRPIGDQMALTAFASASTREIIDFL